MPGWWWQQTAHNTAKGAHDVALPGDQSLIDARYGLSSFISDTPSSTVVRRLRCG